MPGFLAALLGTALAAPPAPPPRVEAARGAVDWDAAGAEAVGVLSGYLATDTVNPPGHEEAGALYLAGVLADAGIPAELIPLAPGRASLVARLPGDGTAPPLCLLSHIDVVPAEAEHWTFPPYSGKVEDGYVYGRGALDMKGMGALETMTLVWLKRLEVPLARDVVLLAVADEEVGNEGMRALVAERWDQIGCSHLVNEGGIGVQGAIFEGQALHAISVAEKGFLWLDLVAEGTAGHGSVAREGEAPRRLLDALEILEKRRPKPRVVPEMRELLRRAGAHHGGFSGMVLKSPFLSDLLVKPRLMKSPTTRSALTDTVHLTGMAGAMGHNVVPSSVRATLDCRLLPGTTADDVLADLRHRTRKIPGISYEVVEGDPPSGSAWEDDPLFDALARYAVEGRPHAVAAPFLSVGFTDSLYARQAGVRAYGYVPFELSGEEADTMHGHDERVSTDNVREGLRRLFSAVVDFAGAPVPVAPPPDQGLWDSLVEPPQP